MAAKVTVETAEGPLKLNEEQLSAVTALVNCYEAASPTDRDDGIPIANIRKEVRRLQGQPDVKKREHCKTLNDELIGLFSQFPRDAVLVLEEKRKICLVDLDHLSSNKLPSLEASTEEEPIEAPVPNLEGYESISMRDAQCVLAFLAFLYHALQANKGKEIRLSELVPHFEESEVFGRFLSGKETKIKGRQVGRWVAGLSKAGLLRYEKKCLYWLTKFGEDVLRTGEVPKGLQFEGARGKESGNGAASTELERLENKEHALRIELQQVQEQIRELAEEQLKEEERLIEEETRARRARIEQLKQRLES